MELRAAALHALSVREPAEKVAATRTLGAVASQLPLQVALRLSEPGCLPGRPERPTLVQPRLVPRRSPATPEGLAHLVHALCHIEFNAINLALDAVWRFADLPPAYYLDWVRVAAEEAEHFELLSSELTTLGMRYGDVPAHDGLWDMCQRTCDSALARMALVPRTLEARGLDVTPEMQLKLRHTGLPQAHSVADRLDIILRDEIGHVAVGNRWFLWLCQQQGLEPLAQYRSLLEQHKAPLPKGPFNVAAREAAGFTRTEFAQWSRHADEGSISPADGAARAAP